MATRRVGRAGNRPAPTSVAHRQRACSLATRCMRALAGVATPCSRPSIDDLSVEIVGLDRAGATGEALPRRATAAVLPVDGLHVHAAVAAFLVLLAGGEVDAGGLQAGFAFGPHDRRELLDLRIRRDRRLDRVREIHEELRVLPAHHVGARDRVEGRRVERVGDQPGTRRRCRSGSSRCRAVR